MSKPKGDVVISADLMDEIVDVLGQHCFSDDGEYNNDEVFNVLQRIKDELEDLGRLI